MGAGIIQVDSFFAQAALKGENAFAGRFQKGFTIPAVFANAVGIYAIFFRRLQFQGRHRRGIGDGQALHALINIQHMPEHGFNFEHGPNLQNEKQREQRQETIKVQVRGKVVCHAKIPLIVVTPSGVHCHSVVIFFISSAVLKENLSGMTTIT
jgi:hypothetical protein